MKKSPFLIVSNRLPVSVSKKDGILQFDVSNGGLATAMSSLDTPPGRLWVGWPGIASEELTPADRRTIRRKLEKSGCYPVFLSRKQVRDFYEGYSNDTLWPLFHYFQSLTRHHTDYWNAYQAVNKQFARTIKRCAEHTATIWVQDYHLMLLPALLREVFPKSLIGFFLHIPFPSYEIFRLLPERAEILRGLLGADLIGFHVYDYARHFLSSVLRLLDAPSKGGVIQYDSRAIKVDAYPIGIDYEKFRETLKSPEMQRAAQTLRDSHPGQKLILSVDRLDYSKGIPERLEAYRTLLAEHPELYGRVKLIVVAVPSRTEVETYKNLRDDIEKMIGRINGTYGTIDWAPISYQFQNLPFEKIVALYNAAHVALVTPLRDGMNLVAKEYVASKTRQSPGVIILSEMAGAIDEMPEALRINPHDTHMVAAAIKRALSMPSGERRVRQQHIQDRIADYTVQRWGRDFINDLSHIKHATYDDTPALSRSKMPTIKEAYTSARSRLFLLDYDGTLQTFKSRPDIRLAKPSKKLLGILSALQHNGSTVCIVSGRSRHALDAWFGDQDLILVAEHGAWLKRDGVWHTSLDDFSEVKQRIMPLMHKYTSRTPGSLVELKDYAVVWHYRNVSSDLAYVRSRELHRVLAHNLRGLDASVNFGHKIIEVRPTGVHKGAVSQQLVSSIAPDFVLAAGDDYTDEDMFAGLPPGSISIKVGPGKTVAAYRVKNVASIVKVLEELSIT